MYEPGELQDTPQGLMGTGGPRIGRGLAAAVVIVLAAACGGGDNDAQPATAEATTSPAPIAETTLPTELDEFSITPEETEAPAGTVTFEATNVGTEYHKISVWKTDLEPDEIHLLSNGAFADPTTPGVEVIDFLLEVDAGQSRNQEVRLAAGKYLLLCNVGFHFKNGMVTRLTVE